MRLRNFSCSVFLGKFGGFHSKSLSMKKKGSLHLPKIVVPEAWDFQEKNQKRPRCNEYSSCIHERTRCSLKRYFQLKKMLQWENFHPLWLHLFPPALRERKVFSQMRLVMCFNGWTRKCIAI